MLIALVIFNVFLLLCIGSPCPAFVPGFDSFDFLCNSNSLDALFIDTPRILVSCCFYVIKVSQVAIRSKGW